MGKLAGDECIIQKRAASCIFPRKCRRDRDRPFLPDLVISEIQFGQWGAEQTVMKRAAEGKPLVLGLWASDAGTDCSIRKRATSCILPWKRCRDSLGTLHPDLVTIEIQGGQRGVDQCLSQCNDCAANTTWVLLLSTAVFVLEVLEMAP